MDTDRFVPGATFTQPLTLQPSPSVATPAPEPTSTQTPTSTVLPTSTRTPSPTPTLTWTPIPTLPPDQALEQLMGLYSNNGGCQLPCWWGITPGETSWQETREILSPLGEMAKPLMKNGVQSYHYAFVVPENISPIGYLEPTLWVENGVVKAIRLNTQWIKPDFDYSLAGLLKTFGQPEEIWVYLVTDSMFEPHYEMDLFYPTKGVMLSASGNAKIQGQFLNICPQKFRWGEFPPGIVLWFSSEKVTYKNFDSRVLGGLTAGLDQKYYLLRNLTNGFDESAFFQTYLDPETTACFDVDLTKLP